MRFSLCVVALLLGTAIVQAAPVAKPVTAPVVAEPLAEKDGLKISISAVITNSFGMNPPIRSIGIKSNDPFIDVVIQNTSDKPLRVFEEWNSLGFYNLTLEVTEVDGQVLAKPIVVSKGLFAWFHNFGSSEVIEPGAAIVREVQLLVPENLNATVPHVKPDSEPSGWLYRNFPLPNSSSPKRIKMRAIFSNDITLNSRKEPVWNGQVASQPLEYNVSWIDDRRNMHRN